MRNLDWNIMDFTLYNETFAGRATVVHYCSSEFHSSAECIKALDYSSLQNTLNVSAKTLNLSGANFPISVLCAAVGIPRAVALSSSHLKGKILVLDTRWSWIDSILD